MNWVLIADMTLDDWLRRNQLWVAACLPDVDRTTYQVWGAMADGGELDALKISPMNAHAATAGGGNSMSLTAFLDYSIKVIEPIVLVVRAAANLKWQALLRISVFGEHIVPVILIGDVLKIAAHAQRLPYFKEKACFCIDPAWAVPVSFEEAS